MELKKCSDKLHLAVGAAVRARGVRIPADSKLCYKYSVGSTVNTITTSRNNEKNPFVYR